MFRYIGKSKIALILAFLFMASLFFFRQGSSVSNILNSDNIVAKVSETPISTSKFNRTLQINIQRFNEILGKNLTSKEIRDFQIPSLALNALINDSLFENQFDQIGFRLDDTIISQCNSHIYLRLKNQKAQKFCRDTSEYADKEDTAQLPNLANGQAIICGQVVNFSLPVQIKFDEELLNHDIQNENFISTVSNWDDNSNIKLRKKFAKDFSNISQSDQRRPN